MDSILEGHDIVYICEGKWSFDRGGHMSSFFPKLAQNNRILYIDLPIAGQYFYKYPSSGIKRFLGSLAGPRKVAANFFTWSLFPFMPYGNRDLSKERANRTLLQGRIIKNLARLGFDKPILIVQRYNSAPWLGAFDEKLSCYLCVDDYAYTTSAYEKDPVVAEIEAQLVKEVDITLCTAELLVTDKIKYNKNCYLMPNAADYKHFKDIDDDRLAVAPELAGIEEPILGLISTTPNRLDFKLLTKMARVHPEWRIVLLGYLDSPEMSLLAEEPNVIYLGWRDFAVIPSYIKAFDVCLIPFKVNPQTNTMNPYKLHEYVATGKALVSTALDEIKAYDKQYPGTIYWAEDPDGFIRCAEEALKEDMETTREKRASAAGENTWDKRLEQFSRIVNEHL